YVVFCLFTLALSYLLNGILVYVVHKRRARIGFYRYFTYAFVIVDVAYSYSFAAAQPFWYAAPGVLAYFSIAPWNNHFTLIRVKFSDFKIAYQIWFVAFLAVLLCITSSFIYRYGLLCSQFIVSMFERPARFVITLFILSVSSYSITNTSKMMIYIYINIRRKVQKNFGTEYNSDFINGYSLMVDLNVFCGIKINNKVKQRKMSNQLRKMHGRALKVLIAQVLAIAFALFPIFNPIIVIYFTEDYRKYVM
ncbi:hypothetical protein PFISCL1PPCAC_12596, partial [Pristionchus fissidentatus]